MPPGDGTPSRASTQSRPSARLAAATTRWSKRIIASPSPIGHDPAIAQRTRAGHFRPAPADEERSMSVEIDKDGDV